MTWKMIATILLLLIAASYISAEEPLRIVYAEYMPFFYKGAGDKPRGILVDFWELWSEKTGVPVTFSALPWAETITQVRDGKADINAGIFYTTDRDTYLDFSQPFFDVDTHLFYHSTDDPLTGVKDLAGVRLGLVTADFSVSYMQENQPEATIVEYPSYEPLVVAAIKGEVEAFVMASPVAMTYLAKHEGLDIIRRVDNPVYTNQFRAGIRAGEQELLELVNEGLSAINSEEVDAIVRSWTGRPKSSNARPTFEKVTIANCIDSIPFHFNDENGRPAGMLVDLWRLWSEKTGIEIEFKSSAWPGTLDMVRDGKADIHAGCFYSEERDKYLDYAAALRGCDTNFFFHDSIFGLKTLDDLIGFKIGVIEKDSAVDYLRRDLPEAVLAEYPSNEALFDAVEKGEVRVFVYDTPATLYFLAQRGLTHRFRHHFDRPLYTSNFYAAVREGNSALVTEINRGMEMITAEERAEIERKWMGASDVKTKDVLVIACAIGYPPFTMLNSEGKPAGLFVDLWRLWAEKTGKTIEFRMSEWADTLEALKNGSADFHSGLYRTEDRSIWMDFSQPIYEVRSNLFYHVNRGEISGLNELDGQKVGALRGSYWSTYLRENWPNVEVVDLETSEAIIIAAGEGRIDAFLDEVPTTLTLLNRFGRLGEFKYLKEPLYSKEIFAGVRKDDPELLAEIDAGLSAITNEEKFEIESSWIPDPEDRYFKHYTGEVKFTAAEEAWLNAHKTIRLGVTPDWLPFEYIEEDGSYMGMVSGYIRILNEKIGMRMEIVPDLSWPEVLAKGKTREIDVFSCAVETPERKAFMNFTNPYLSFPCVIITRKHTPFIGGLRDLYGQKVSIERDYCTHEDLQTDYPAIDLYVVDSTLEALEALSLGKADAYVGNLATASYQIQKEGLTNLKVAAPTSFSNYDLKLAVRSDWPEMIGILNKCLASITPQQHDEIRQKWFSIRFEHGIDPGDLWRLGLQIGGVAAVILVVALLWNIHIRNLKERFRGLTEHGMDVTQAFKESGEIVYQSPSHTKILGYEPKELLGKSAFDLFHEDDRSQWDEVLESLLSNKGVQFFEHRIRNKQGSYQDFESNCINLLDNKAIKAIVINARDVTERKKAEEARRENEDKLQTITSSARDAIIMMDNNGKISYWNEAAVGMFGYTKEKAIGQKLHTFIAPKRYHEAYRKGFSKFQKTGEGNAVGKMTELTGAKKDGTEFPFELSLSSVCIKGEWNAIGLLRDITEHKQMEMQLMQSEKMASLGMLVAGVAHEINTPIGAINSMHNTLVRAIERLKSTLSTMITEESDGQQKINKMLKVIEDANKVLTSGTERVTNIVKRLRSFARLDEAELKQVDIHEGIEDTLTMVHHELKNKVAVERRFGDVSPIFCYPSQLNQVYLNLLINAIQAIEDKGKITITTFQQDNHVHIQFNDTGVGIPEEAINRLFVPGYTTKDRGVGTGLGLSICHQIVKSHDGDILVESEVGKGTTFTVVLPLRVTREYKNKSYRNFRKELP